MSMGYASAYADTIEEKSVKKFCPKEFQALQNVIDETPCTWEDVARAGNYGDIEKDCGKEIYSAYQKLYDAFEKKTGLQLFIAYHDSEDEGDRYDDVNGIYWGVNGMYQLTPAGKKMNKYVERKTFVQFS